MNGPAARRALRSLARALAPGVFRAFDGAASAGPTASNWRPRSTSANAEVSAGAATLRARSRDLIRNNPHARRGVNSLVANLIGSGIRPRAATEDKALNKRLDDLWERWGEQAHIEHDLDVYGMQALAVRGMIESGESLMRMRVRRPEDGLMLPVQLQVLEADMLDAAKAASYESGARIVQGVEFDPIDRRSAYWLLGAHPGDTDTASAFRNGLRDSYQSSRVDARNIAHVYHATRPGQVRGVPWTSAVIMALRELGDLRSAELVRKRMEACHVGVVERGDELDADADPGINWVTDTDGNRVETFEPGMILYAPHSVKFNAPSGTPGAAEYERMQLHAVGAGLDVPYHALTGDMTGANFSSLRAGNNEAWLYYEQLRWHVVIPLLCAPMWRWFLAAAQALGDAPQGWIPVRYECPSVSSVNPLQDVKADIEAVNARFKSPQQVIGERGYNAADVIADLAAWDAMVAEAGLASPAPAAPPPAAAEDDTEDDPDAEDTGDEPPAKKA